MIEMSNMNDLYKIKVTALLLIFNTGHLLAQEIQERSTYQSQRFKSKIEIQGGPGLSFLRGSAYVKSNEVYSRSLKLGYSFGVGLTQLVGRNFEVTANILFERKGGIVAHYDTYYDEITQNFKQGNVKENYIYDYYTFPILIKCFLGTDGIYQVGLGPYFSILERQIVKTTFSPQGIISIEDQTSFNHKLDLGVTINFSRYLRINDQLSVKISVLNNWGVANIRAYENYGVLRTFNINLLLGFIIKK